MIQSRHALVLASVVFAIIALSTATSGFSVMQADRGTEVNVADDESAVLGFEQSTQPTDDGTVDCTVNVTNRFPTGDDLDALTVVVDDQSVELGPLDSGETNGTTFRSVACGDPITVMATLDGASVTLTRSVQC